MKVGLCTGQARLWRRDDVDARGHPALGSSCGARQRLSDRLCGRGNAQLSQAVSFLHPHRQFVRLVTVDIGGSAMSDE